MFHVKHLCSPCGEEGDAPLFARADRVRRPLRVGAERASRLASAVRAKRSIQVVILSERSESKDPARRQREASRLAPREAFILVDSSARNPLASERKTLRERPRQQKLPNIGSSVVCVGEN